LSLSAERTPEICPFGCATQKSLICAEYVVGLFGILLKEFDSEVAEACGA
jgi:hypothetical protein